MSSILERLEQIFDEQLEICSVEQINELVQLMTLTDQECEQRFSENKDLRNSNLLDKYFSKIQFLENKEKVFKITKTKEENSLKEGHYANECPNRQQSPEKVKLIKEAEKEGYYPSENIFDDYTQVYSLKIYQSSTDSDSSSDISSSSTVNLRERIYNYEQVHCCQNELLYSNISNSNFIYIKGNIFLIGYITLTLHCYVDTGRSLCLASKHVIPEDIREETSKDIKVTIINPDTIKLAKVGRNLIVYFSGEPFHIPILYQQETGIPLLLENTFCQLYGPFSQWIDRISFHLNEGMILIKTLTKASQIGKTSFLESMKIDSLAKQIPGTNITQEVIKPERFFLEIKRYQKIEELLEKLCSENPIDPEKSNCWMNASLELIDPKTVVREKPMKYSPQDREEFGKQIKELLEVKLIIPSKSGQMSPGFLLENEAERRRGKKRMVENYKAINAATKGDSHNLPCIQELLSRLRLKRCFSIFEQSHGFWQVLINQEPRLLTAFTSPDGHYQWRVVLFGLKQAPSIYERQKQNALRGLENYCTVYVDDIILFSDSVEKQYSHVLSVFKTTESYGIIRSSIKTNLFNPMINYLSYHIYQGTHCPLKHILENLHKFQNTLEDKKHFPRYLGVLTYAESYIQKLADLWKLLQVKLKTDYVWKWKQSDTRNNIQIKKILTRFPKLYLPKEKEFLIIETDSSNDYWRGVLKANTDAKEEVCTYPTGSFKTGERIYDSNYNELLIIKNIISKFSIYLTPVKFLVSTDSRNFTYFLKTKILGDNKQGRLVRWQMWFSRYFFDIEHIEGEKNVLADCLTRDFQN
uniref:Enzymatic polyprotein n=1 Tax=Dahlia mosaic virus TaxID=213888 RepID=S5PVU4_DMV|nr:reverse transcriptase [Dahlia mosaic virus]